MDQADRDTIVTALANDPLLGTPIAGGARKVRVAGRRKGKSGGYRVITYYGGADIPVFLITVFGKGEKDNLTKAERNNLATLTNMLRDSLTGG